MFDVLGVAALLAVAALGVWLVLRARRARNGAVKWIGGLLAGVVTLASVLAFALVLVGFYKVNFPAVRGTPSDIKVAATPEQLARGSKIAKICAGCHSPTEEPPLTGQNMFANGGPPVGTMYAANLTPAGEIKDWTDGEVIRAIREGIHKNGRSLIVMPAEVFRNLSDADVQSVVAFLRSQPATGAQTPPTKLNIVGALLIALVFPTAAQTLITQPVVAPVEGTSADCDDRSQLDRRAVRSDDSYGHRSEQARAHGRDALAQHLRVRDRRRPRGDLCVFARTRAATRPRQMRHASTNASARALVLDALVACV